MFSKKKTIEITIGVQGDTTIEAKGFQGKACQDATKPYEEALGLVIADRDTPEMYQAPAQATTGETLDTKA